MRRTVSSLSWMFLLALGLAAAWIHGCKSDDDADEPIVAVKVIDDRPGSTACTDPLTLPNPAPDVNNMPQAEVTIDVAPDGRIAAAAKDLRYGPPEDTTYNRRVWNGLYLSSDAGQTWSNRMFDDHNPNVPLQTTTTGLYGRPAGVPVTFTHQSDPALGFDGEGNLYTCGLAVTGNDPGVLGDPTAITVSRRDPSGNLAPGRLHFISVEADADLFNDKNWIAVERDAPAASTVVVASWKLFNFAGGSPGEGGYIAVSADGAATFSPPIRLPLPEEQHAAAQFYQPFIGPDPSTGRKTLYVMWTRFRSNTAISMGLLKAPIDQLTGGTAGLQSRLSSPASWTVLPERLGPVARYGSNGFGGSFRSTSFFYPALDRSDGRLYVVSSSPQGPDTGSRVTVSSSSDGGVTWGALRTVDDPEDGHQLMPAAAADGGVLSLLWYDSRNDSAFTPRGLIRGIDVYYAELDSGLQRRRVVRLTPQTQQADRPVFSQEINDVQLTLDTTREAPRRRPHDVPPAAAEGQPRAICTPYGFIGDYIGVAADREAAYAAWCDLRDMSGSSGACAGGNCRGGRNQNVYVARIPK